MAKFSYTVKDINGKTSSDVADSFDRAVLIQDLQKKGFFVVNVQELKATDALQLMQRPGKKKKFAHKKIKLEDQILFARQLTTMLEAGVTLLRSLDVIVSQVASENFYKVLNRVRGDVEQGSSLSAALAKHPKVFNQFWVSLVEVGEASGTMPMVLNKLAFYLEQQAAFQASIISAIIYPVILFVVAMGAVAFFALVVGPKFEDIFNSMRVELPLITKVLLGTFKMIRKNFLMIIGLSIALFFVLKAYISTYKGRSAKEKILFSLPQIGEIYKLIIL